MNIDYIYKVKIGKNQYVYYLDPEDVQPFLNNPFVKVFYIKVSTDDAEYLAALYNSISNNKQNND
jgi:hypothetical protein